MKLTSAKIQDWLKYWQRANIVSVDEIHAFGDVYQARKYCECMRVGIFANVTDLQIWRALSEMRA
jgi:hypothetical protein